MSPNFAHKIYSLLTGPNFFILVLSILLIGCSQEETAYQKCINYESAKLRLQPDSVTNEAIKNAGYDHYIPTLEGKVLAYANYKGFKESRRLNQVEYQLQNEPKAQSYYDTKYELYRSDSFGETYQALLAFENYKINAEKLDSLLTKCKEDNVCVVELSKWERLQSEGLPTFLPVNDIYTNPEINNEFENIEQRLISLMFEYISALDKSQWSMLIPDGLKVDFNNLLSQLNENEDDRIFKIIDFFLRVPLPSYAQKAESTYMYQKRLTDFYSSEKYKSELLNRFRILITKPSLDELAKQKCESIAVAETR